MIKSVPRPNIFTYHDYREFLNDWWNYLKSARRYRTLNDLGALVGVHASYLTKVLHRARPLTPKLRLKLVPHLDLKENELRYFESLCKVTDSSSQTERLSALKHLHSFKQYKDENASEADVFQYFSHWYHLAIRNLAKVHGFKLDPVGSGALEKASPPERSQSRSRFSRRKRLS